MRLTPELMPVFGASPSSRTTLCSRASWHKVAFLAGLLGALSGCPDPQGEFDDFVERFDAIHGGGEGGEGTGGAPDCVPTTPAEADGIYLFALSASLNAKKAFAFDATVTTADDGSGGLTLDLSLQPLSKDDQVTPVGDPIVAEDLAVAADGSFDWDFGQVTLIGAANPLTGNDVIATLQLHGSICGGDDLGFICGDVTGNVTSPIMLDLEGSTFTFQRYEGDKPAPVINCAKDPAEY
ncbi:MAG: hypothetical protein HOW73_36600 [Polyangiaceae bacterium]|nr:hypothetical protein [Polyangiaceae bacterium]